MTNKSKLSKSHNTLEIIYQDCSGTHTRYRLKRRDFLKTGAALGTAVFASVNAPAIIASDRSIKIGSYGGYFEDSFIDHVHPEFQKATGIKVESVTQPNSTGWLTTMEQATKAGAVPADLSLYDKIAMIRGRNIGGLFQPFDLAKIPNLQHLDDTYVYKNPDNDDVLGIGVMG